ncbi:MAG: Guanylate kinase [Candidatus Saccharibacteria bacterium GW2011_GWA2_46_10]|nr:MAG: Guanylate kinase [Candidatus Saccharibacteria bacterium GW2011_GWA2_46_10]OGL34584.1 MAG: hypothetical protein A3F05_01540 [Candidatus Saccharibacteria bacterium RIFCSPHIGHO2_12_FULL_47_17]
MEDDYLRSLVENYRPNDATLKTISQLKLVATVAPSSSGKTSIMQAAAKASVDIHMVLGETTRAPRLTEKPGIDYLFRSYEEVLAELKRGDLVDVIIGPSGGLYCTRPANYLASATNVMALVAAAIPTFRSLPFKYFKAVFIVPAQFKLWQSWLNRQAEVGGWTKQDWRGRLAEARQSYEIALADSQMLFILNDVVDKATDRLLQVVQGEPPADHAEAKNQASFNYQRLLQLTDLYPPKISSENLGG